MSDHKETIPETLKVMRLLEGFGLSTQTIKYMAMIAMEDSSQEENYYAEEVFRRVVRYCIKPEIRAALEERQEKVSA